MTGDLSNIRCRLSGNLEQTHRGFDDGKEACR